MCEGFRGEQSSPRGAGPAGGCLGSPRCSPPPSPSAPQGWTSRPTKTRRVTRRPTSWRSTRTPRNAPSGPTRGSTGPSPPTGASSPPPPQSESPVPGGSGPCLGLGTPFCLQVLQGGFSSLGAQPETLPSEGREFPREPGRGLLNMMLGKSLRPCNPSRPSGAFKGLYPAVQPYTSPEPVGNPKSAIGSLPARQGLPTRMATTAWLILQNQMESGPPDPAVALS